MQRQTASPFSKSFEVEFRAIAAAHARGECFTVQAFCNKYGFKVNRHTRGILNALVAQGLLVKHKTMYDDGHYRMVYAAQKPASMPGAAR